MPRTARPNVLILTALWLTAAAAAAQDDVSSLLAQLSKGPADQSLMYAIEGQRTDPRILPALKAAFEKGTAKEERQLIAATLLRLGGGTGEHFDYLAGYATTAVDDRTPMFIRYDAKGAAVRGQLDPGFENWCSQNEKDPHEAARLLASVYPSDVRILAYAQDPQAVPLLRRGLESPNAFVAAYAAQGLGRLGDSSAIPLIRKACENLRADEKLVIAMQLPWFTGPDAEQLMRELAPDPNLREMFVRLARVGQLIERNNALRRAGVTPPDQAHGK